MFDDIDKTAYVFFIVKVLTINKLMFLRFFNKF